VAVQPLLTELILSFLLLHPQAVEQVVAMELPAQLTNRELTVVRAAVEHHMEVAVAQETPLL
jgi:hypothetical protein